MLRAANIAQSEKLGVFNVVAKALAVGFKLLYLSHSKP